MTPAQDDAVERLIATDAARWIDHADPLVRGEAALVLAHSRDPRNHRAILDVARDSAEQARLRGLLALGIQASPGVTRVLDEILADQTARTSAAGVCAAYALGALPPEHDSALVSRTLSSFRDGNWKRQGPVLLALLHGMAQHPEHGQATALQQLYAIRANRDPAIRAMLLRLMLPAATTPNDEPVLELLDSARRLERLEVLRWLAGNAAEDNEAAIRPVERLARTSRLAEERAAALAVLTRLRHPPAIELAAKALRSTDVVEVEQGMRSALTIGGAGMRLALERHLLDCKDPELAAAMLRSWKAPPSIELADYCATLATNRQAPLTARVAAVTTLARSDKTRASPLLRDLFRATDSSTQLTELSRAIVSRSTPMPQLSRLLPDPADAVEHPMRWRALLAASHPGATRRLLDVLGQPRPETAELLAALAAFRYSVVTRPRHDRVTRLPEPLPQLLGS